MIESYRMLDTLTTSVGVSALGAYSCSVLFFFAGMVSKLALISRLPQVTSALVFKSLDFTRLRGGSLKCVGADTKRKIIEFESVELMC